MTTLFSDDIARRIAARVLHDHGIEEEIEELFAFSIRVPASTKALIDEMAENSGLSRNSMIIELLQAGIQSVMSCLPPEVAEEMRQGAGERM